MRLPSTLNEYCFNRSFRAVSHITGFVLRQQRNGGCRVGYIAHCDPQGTLPPWLVNKVTHSLGPRMVKDLRKAASGYKKWKGMQPHNRKPWRSPEEMISPRISILDVSINVYHYKSFILPTHTHNYLKDYLE